MSKAASFFTLGIAILLVPLSGLNAQTSDQDIAVNQAVYRQANLITLRARLADAQAAAARGDLANAAKLYDDAWELVLRVGSGIDAEARDTRQGLAGARLELARAAQRRNDFRAAAIQINDVLRVDPSNREAIELKRFNDKSLDAQKGLVPSEETQATIPAIIDQKTKAATLVQDGRLLFEMGKPEEAEKKLKEAIKMDPQNQAAYYYMNLIREARFQESVDRRDVESRQKLVEVERAWENPTKRDLLPVPNPYARTNISHTSKSRQIIYNKLDKIRLDSKRYEGLPLSEVVNDLNDEAKKRDPEKRGLNFLINNNIDTGLLEEVPNANNNNPNNPGGVRGAGAGPGAVGAIDPTTGLPIAAAAQPEQEKVDIGSIPIRIVPALTDVTLGQLLDAIVKVASPAIKYSVEDYAIVISFRGMEPIPLYTRIIKVDPNTFVQGLENVMGVPFGSGGSTGGGNNGNSGGNSGGFGGNSGGFGGNSGGFGGNGGGSGSGATTIPRVTVAAGGGMGGMGGMMGGMGGMGGYGGGMGGMGGYGGGMGGMGGMMGGMGGMGGYGGGMGGMGGMMGGMGGMGGMMGGMGGMGMMGGMGGLGGGGITGVTTRAPMGMVQMVAQQYFMSMGVNLNPPKTMFWNDREGTLIVRATLLDLDIIEAAVQVLNIAPPVVNVKAKFIEVTQDDTQALGFDWYLGNVLMGQNGGVAVSGGTAPSYAGAPSQANPNGFFPGTSLSTVQPPSASDGLVTSGLGLRDSEVKAPAIATITGILTDPQFRVVIQALDKREGVDLLNEASVTTLSGRQTQIQVVDLVTIVTGTSINQNAGGTSTDVNNIGTSSSGAIGSSVNYPTAVQALGPTLDVIPYVSADGYTIQMTILPTIAEFVGYDDPGGFIPQAQSVSGQGGVGIPLRAQLPLPHFKVRQVTTSAVIWDGQTVVVGGLISEAVLKMKDKVPILGDLPLIGRLFRAEGSRSRKKNLMIFVTPTILDSAGNRLHTEDEMPFAQVGIPTASAAPAGIPNTVPATAPR